MRAVQLTAWKQRPEVRDVAEPSVGPGEVLIRIGGAGMCHSDVNMFTEIEPGVLPFDPPFTLGHENAGWVEAVGPAASGLEIGQPVAVYGPWGCGRCYRCQQGAENFCERQAELGSLGGGFGLDGGMARLMVAPSPRHLVPLAALHPVDAAPLADAGLTPYHVIKRFLPTLVPGSHVVVIGAGGGLGHLAVQLLQALCPSTVVGVETSAERLDVAMQLGADHGVLAGPDAATEVRDLTGGRGAELILDLAGTDATLALAAAVSRALGHISIVGAAGGTLAYGYFVTPYEVTVGTTFWGSLSELVELIALADRGLVRSRVQRYPLSKAMDAFDALIAGEVDGRAVLVPED